ncbi:hypothetical protein [Nonomuraea pusilla]|uniref:Uncharacterized protein n=1 Tax=Nonomuraea pusilla TaxID=46177 RepID=A0A1H8A0E9_9ACTN|nr:hypothetical protein [Nonomuraea pusilla]SEM64215.1 hypothetical protein SAMN05660976_05717 [Nonomuraea pusilla]
MSVDLWRWAQRAQQLRFEQLEIARKQAESWRTGLAGITALLAAVLVVKGKETVDALAHPFVWLVPLFLVVALGLLIWATLTAVSAASGSPSDQTLLTGEDLRDWTRGEVERVQDAISKARVLTVSGVAVVALALGMSWLGPRATRDASLVVVESVSGHLCGLLVDTAGGGLIIKAGTGHQIIALKAITRIRPVPVCPA